jgi:prevent-host-death family protein
VSWQSQEAKQKFSELVRRTLAEGPQVITRHGEEVVVVVPVEEFRLVLSCHPQHGRRRANRRASVRLVRRFRVRVPRDPSYLDQR